MKIQIGNNSEPQETNKTVIIIIGSTRYRLSESIEGKLRINKTSDNDRDGICIYPGVSNEIELD